MSTPVQPKVSIIVPCCNVSRYLDECLRSIVAQTLHDIEIICINDGSVDNTLDIINKYARDDARFVVIDKPNEGYGRTMNRGLDAATGEYIAIVESDDYIEADAMEHLYRTAREHDADMVKADFVFFDNDTRRESPSWSINLDPDMMGTVFAPARDNPDIIWCGHPSIWTCLYSTKMLRDSNIRFVETPGASFQDMGFKPKTLIATKRFFYTPKIILHYRKHENNSDKTNGKIFAVCDAHDDTDAWLRTYRPDLGNMKKILNQARFSNYVWNLYRLSGDAKEKFRKRFQSEFLAYKRAGELERTYFDGKSWMKLYTVIYPKNPIWRILRTMTVIISPIYKTRIRNGYKVTYLFNTLPVHRRRLASALAE